MCSCGNVTTRECMSNREAEQAEQGGLENHLPMTTAGFTNQKTQRVVCPLEMGLCVTLGIAATTQMATMQA